VSYSIDVNVLLYASDESSAFYGRARAFLERCANRTEVLCLTWPMIMGYLRIATHPSIFRIPLSPEDARENVEQLISLVHVRLITEQEGFWDAYQEVTRGLVVRGTMAPDCHMAALLKQHDVRTLYTHDADFRRFAFLNVRNPLEGDEGSA
jgi:toxin-antitoxin system PIN domain toxin